MPVRRDRHVDRALKRQLQRMLAHHSADEHGVIHLDRFSVGQPELTMNGLALARGRPVRPRRGASRGRGHPLILT